MQRPQRHQQHGIAQFFAEYFFNFVRSTTSVLMQTLIQGNCKFYGLSLTQIDG